MKKKLTVIIAAVVAVLSLCSLAGCGNDTTDVKANGNVGLTVSFTAKSSVMSITDTTSVKDYMDALAKNNELVFGGENGNFGYFVDSFFGLKAYSISATANSSEGYAWSFYIDFITLEGDEAVYAGDYQTYDYNGATLYLANYGVSGVPCVEGHTYVFVYEYYNYSW